MLEIDYEIFSAGMNYRVKCPFFFVDIEYFLASTCFTLHN